MRITKFFALCLVFIMTLSSPGIRSQIPKKISYQGILTDALGRAISDSSCTMTFTLYDSQTNGTLLWSEEQVVSVNNGLFSVALGSIQPLDLPFDRPYWLGIRVGNGPELPMRIALTSSPYSLRAETAAGLAENAVGREHLQEGAVVKSINSLTDDITLLAGPNIIITQNRDTLKIAAEIVSGNTLGQAYNQGGAGAGRTIVADAGAVTINGPDGLIVEGKIGVGVSNPQYKLDVQENSGNALIQIGRASADLGWVGYALKGGNGNWYMYMPENGTALCWGRGEGAKMVLTDVGNLGIGTGAPNYRLDIAGMAQMQGFKMPTGASPNYVLTSDANGVGTWKPAPMSGGDITAVYAGTGLTGGGTQGDVTLAISPLGVVTGMIANDAITSNKIANDAVTSAKIANGAIMKEDLGFTVPNGYSLDAADGSPMQVVYVNNDGFVGINTVSPIERLHVKGNILSTGNLYGNTLFLDGNVNLASGAPHIYTGNSASDITITFDNPGVGKANLQVNGLVHSTSGGFRFPDGTTQTTAATGTGDITAVGAGNGLTGGGSSGDVTLDVGAGTGILVSTDAVSLNTTFTDGLYVNEGQPNSINTAMVIDGTLIGNDINPTAIIQVAKVQGGGTTAMDVGVYGAHSSGYYGYLGSNSYGVYGNSANIAVYGVSSGIAVRGDHGSGNFGVLGESGCGVRGQNRNGNWGQIASDQYGVYGRCSSGGNYGYLGGGIYGAYGYHQASGNYGYLGSSQYGVFGRGSSIGVYGEHSSGNFGYLGSSGWGVYGQQGGGSHAGYFSGNVHVTGTLTKGGGGFKIDHPLDPENKYLQHAFVESPDMMNIYSGNVILDQYGEAWVQLPDYFESLNMDFRYQLTCVGGFAPVYIAEKIKNNRFKIAGGKEGLEVSWQVSGTRNDAFARLHRIQPEIEKEVEYRGKYLFPRELNKSEQLGIDYFHRQKYQQAEIKEW